MATRGRRLASAPGADGLQAGQTPGTFVVPTRVGAGGNESMADFHAGIMTAARAGGGRLDFHGDGKTPTAAQGGN